MRVSQTSTGVKAGDKIIKVKNTDIKNYTITQVLKLIDEDTNPEMKVTRDGTNVSSQYRKIRVMRGGRDVIL